MVEARSRLPIFTSIRRYFRQKDATMPAHIKIIHAHDFIKGTPAGYLGLERARELLNEIASASSLLAEYKIFLDTRKAQSELSITELWYLAAELSNLREAFSRKTAVLCPPERFDDAEFFALCAQNRGLLVNAFTSFEAAIEWLIERLDA
jgi:hypothetical protein